jgi:hypothetical protein
VNDVVVEKFKILCNLSPEEEFPLPDITKQDGHLFTGLHYRKRKLILHF